MWNTRNLLLVLAVTFFGTGCASLSEQQLSDRTTRNLDYAERFKADRERCAASGRRIVVSASGVPGRDGVPRHRDKYFCV